LVRLSDSNHHVKPSLWREVEPYNTFRSGYRCNVFEFTVGGGPGVWREKTNISRKNWNGQEEA
jgi:hypothetical protein